ncbi:flippase [Flavobacterium sp. RSP46]|uniref:flippase n=1 Tax=Flavobacterium sp. RSP46 TaxID=2497486 RepID=UPI000F870960|nr:flippase [Flavobacterium sp. RSP46]RTY91107.1 flippase [Flavobacterium sp. RSP46]
MKTANNFFFNLIQSLSSVLFPLITFPYASRILGPEGIGLTNFAENFCRYFMLFAALGIPIYGVREIAKISTSLQLRSKIFSEIIVIHFTASCINVLVYLLIIFSFDKFQNHLGIYLLGAFYIFINTFSIEWFFNGLSEFKFIALRSVVIRFLFVVGLFVLVRNSSDVFWYFSLNVIVLFVNNLISIYYCKNKTDFSIKDLEIKKHIKPLFYIFLSTLAISLYILIDTLLLGFLRGDTYVGYYTLASKLNKVPLTFIVALGIVLIPQLTLAAHEKNMVSFKKLIQKSTDFVVMLGVPITIVLFLCSKQLIVLFSGPEFLPATNSMQILTGVSLLIGLSNIYGMQILVPLGEDKKLLISVLIGTILSLTLNFILIPIWADFGAALTNLLSELAVTILMGYFASRIINIGSPIKTLALQIISYSPIIVFGFYINQYIYSDLLYMIIISFLILVTFLFVNLKLLKTPLAIESLEVIKQKIGI